MLSIDLTELNQLQLTALVDHIYQRCDYFSVTLPNYKQHLCGSRMRKNREFRKYMKNIKPIYDNIEPHVTFTRITKSFMNSKYSYVLEIKVAKLYKGFKKILLSNGSFFNWLWPDMPEDLCFYIGEKCWMMTLSHEDECIIFDENETDIKMLEDNNILYGYCNGYMGFESTPTYND